MTYEPYLVANFATGFTNRMQPWLLADDAQESLLDGDVYRGVLSKRTGYNYYATGERSGAPYVESRIINTIPFEQARTSGGVLVVGDGTPGPYVFQIENAQEMRGSITITAGAQTATDDGLGTFVTAPVGGTGTINYLTGDVSITFLNNVAGGTQLTLTYSYYPGLPVMMIANFVTATNVKQLIVADTKRLNRYNTTTNRLEYLGRTIAITNITQANPGNVTAVAHGLFTGDKIFISGVVGMNEVNNLEFTITKTGADNFTIGVDTTAYTAYTSGGTVELIYSSTSSDFFSWVNYPDKDNNPRLLFTNNVNQIGYYAPNLTPSVGDYVFYPTVATPDFQMLATTTGTPPVTVITCSQLVVFKDRLLMLRTTENGNIYGQRIRISGTGASCDDFRTSATGAGFIDIPDGTWIQGASFNRDDLIIFTEQSTWVLKYTGNDTVPFVIDRIDESRGCEAPFSVITYLNRTSAASTRGLIITDGYKVERQDEEIPDFSFNQIDGDNFKLCFAGSVDANRDHFLIYPPPTQSESKRILVTNYDEDNYSVYRLPLSCMGTYVSSYDLTWNDLLIYPNWDAFAAAYGDWNSFAYNSGAPFSLGGGHKGEIWKLNVNEVEDNPVRIRNITIISADTIEVTTDWNNYSLNSDDPSKGADTIFITGVLGMLEVNNQQYPITSVTSNNVFRVNVPSSSAFSSYTSGGVAQRVIPFSSLFKKFNPYVGGDKKVRCGWLYMYVSTSGTNLKRNISITDATQADPCVITTNVNHNLSTGDQVSIFGVGGMTQLNGTAPYVTVLTPLTFSLDGVDSSAYGAYTSGGYVSVAENCKANINVIVNDVGHDTQLNNPNQQPYQGTVTNLSFEDGVKKWYKVYINQTGRFIQFRVGNLQAGAKIDIHAIMPGFQSVGRLI